MQFVTFTVVAVWLLTGSPVFARQAIQVDELFWHLYHELATDRRFGSIYNRNGAAGRAVGFSYDRDLQVSWMPEPLSRSAVSNAAQGVFHKLLEQVGRPFSVYDPRHSTSQADAKTPQKHETINGADFLLQYFGASKATDSDTNSSPAYEWFDRTLVWHRVKCSQPKLTERDTAVNWKTLLAAVSKKKLHECRLVVRFDPRLWTLKSPSSNILAQKIVAGLGWSPFASSSAGGSQPMPIGLKLTLQVALKQALDKAFGSTPMYPAGLMFALEMAVKKARSPLAVDVASLVKAFVFSFELVFFREFRTVRSHLHTILNILVHASAGSLTAIGRVFSPTYLFDLANALSNGGHVPTLPSENLLHSQPAYCTAKSRTCDILNYASAPGLFNGTYYKLLDTTVLPQRSADLVHSLAFALSAPVQLEDSEERRILKSILTPKGLKLLKSGANSAAVFSHELTTGFLIKHAASLADDHPLTQDILSRLAGIFQTTLSDALLAANTRSEYDTEFNAAADGRQHYLAAVLAALFSSVVKELERKFAAYLQIERQPVALKSFETSTTNFARSSKQFAKSSLHYSRSTYLVTLFGTTTSAFKLPRPKPIHYPR